jgi:hypothetical protein
VVADPDCGDHLSSVWIQRWPWWKPLEDNPRYSAMVADIESKLAEQRALLAAMEESESTSL